ncbi:MAG: hypothetical protein U0228_26165 [Myxococcaceae bacterium]
MRRSWALALSSLVFLAALVARADLFSPGELSKPHATLEGLSNCTKCHPAGGQLSQATCLSCHQELGPRIARGAGLHGQIPEAKRNCETCHHEHKGLGFKLIDWGGPEKDFNHNRTGWALKGKHGETKCASCHEKRLMSPASLKLMDKRPETRLGLGTGCTDCHFDEHRGQQQEDCEYCHVEKAWKPAPNFNHNDTAYPLKGKHVGVKCSGCHDSEKDPEPHSFPLPKSETFLRLAPVEHKACLDCHKDPHEGRFGLRCQSCHTVEGWRIVRNAGAEREFHQKTKFPLEGAHLDVDCKTCHGPFPGVPVKFKGLPHEHCATCHPDAHEGQLGGPVGSGANAMPDCNTCHAATGFTPVKYGLVEHQKTKFALEGGHQVVPCSSCHAQTPALKAKVPKVVLADLKKRGRQELFSAAMFDFTKPLEQCESCHTDVHSGQFKGQACESCHQVASFKGTSLKFDHAKSNFPLVGAHVKVKCEKCHFAPAADKAIVYKPLAQKCESCHLDVHAGQFGKKACDVCHGADSFKDKLLFQHQPPFTAFVLDGQHLKAKCDACHKSIPVGPKLNVTQYKPLPTSCEGCHSDFHKGAFKGFEP